MRRDYSPYLERKKIYSFTANDISFRTQTPVFKTSDDLYKSIGKAQERSYNIGCSGYRKVTVSAKGDTLYGPCSSASTYTDIMKKIQGNSMARRYYQFDPTDNLYDIRDSAYDNIRSGYDYKEKIFQNTMSNVIFRDPKKSEILYYLQRVVFALIESVKQIRNSFNYTVPFNNKRVF
jgi:hypothetical protein